MSAPPPDLSSAFYVKWCLMAHNLGADPVDLARVAYCESEMRANAHNLNGHASGLIQFMPDTLLGLGWTKGHDAFRQLTAEEQVPFCERYFRPHAGKLITAVHAYVVVFLPATLPGILAATNWREYPMCGHRGPLAWAYKPNEVLDQDGDGIITPGDLEKWIDKRCRGARWDAIVHFLTLAMGRPSTAPPEPPDTEPELPSFREKGDSEPPEVHPAPPYTMPPTIDGITKAMQDAYEAVERKRRDEEG